MNKHHVFHYLIALLLAVVVIILAHRVFKDEDTVSGALGIEHYPIAPDRPGSFGGFAPVEPAHQD